MLRPSARAALPVLSAANFIIGMGAMMVVGLINPVSQEFGISAAQAGWMMTAYALSYGVVSPLLVSFTGRIGRRRVLAAGLGVFALSCVVAALAPNQATLLGARALAAAGAGIVTPVAAAVAAGLAPPDRQARALANVFFGLTLAQVAGVPVGTWVAYTYGWRSAFWMVAVLALPVIGLVWTLVPAGLQFRAVTLGDLARTLSNGRHMLAVAFTAFFMGALYVLFTYLTPLVNETMGLGRNGITLMLLVAGFGAVLGNIVGGQITDRIGPSRTLWLLVLAQAAIMSSYSALPVPYPVLLLMGFCWSVFGWSFMAAQQVRLMGLDPANASVLFSLNAAAIYLGGALGSVAGAMVFNVFGLIWVGLAGGLAALLAGAVLSLADHLNRDPQFS